MLRGGYAMGIIIVGGAFTVSDVSFAVGYPCTVSGGFPRAP
jgi:hypothetical protein